MWGTRSPRADRTRGKIRGKVLSDGVERGLVGEVARALGRESARRGRWCPAYPRSIGRGDRCEETGPQTVWLHVRCVGDLPRPGGELRLVARLLKSALRHRPVDRLAHGEPDKGPWPLRQVNEGSRLGAPLRWFARAAGLPTAPAASRTRHRTCRWPSGRAACGSSFPAQRGSKRAEPRR